MLQRDGDIGADNIGPRRQHLAQLDIGGPEPFQRAGKPHAGVGLARPKRQSGPGQQARGMDQTQEIRNRAHYSRQAECIAAMPPDKLRIFTWDRPASVIMCANFAWGGKRRMLSAR